MGDAGSAAEQAVEERIGAVLPEGARAFANVRWLSPTRDGGPARNGEIDLLLVLPEVGLLVIETKGGQVSRDGFGRWYGGSRRLDVSPFEQAETSCRAIAAKVTADARWRGQLRTIHAVAFPNTDRESLGRGGRDLGTDAPVELVFDRGDLASDDAASAALARVVAFWSGDGARDRSLSDAQLAVISDVVEPEIVLRSLLRSDLEEGERELRAPTQMQLATLRTLRGVRRASITGCAGSGKSLLAVEKARSLAHDGFDTLLVCYNQPLSRAFLRDPALRPFIASERLVVATFHELCRRFAADAGTLPAGTPGAGPAWFEALPGALDRAMPVAGGRFQAIVVDEGQDFDELWLLLLTGLLVDPLGGILYVFHDPSQAIYRPDHVASLGLDDYPLLDNCRNARPIHDFAFRFYDGGLDVEAIREDGRAPLVVAADGEAETLAAIRDVLHTLVHQEHVDRSQIAVLTGVGLDHSAVWRQRRFKGDLTLWNGSVGDAGKSLGLSADQVPDQPAGTILCETIHRFKGLERDVVILVELRTDDARLDKLLYVGASRAKHHLVVIVPAELSLRFSSMGPA